MKILTHLGILLFIVVSCQQEDQNKDATAPHSQTQKETADVGVEDTTVFDAEMAKTLGADQYGMKKYVIAFLKTGPNPSKDSTARMEMQKAHMDNINRMVEEGVLVLAGPFLDGGELRGIYVFDVETVEEARKWTATDPAVQAGVFEMELHPWYGSAAIMKIKEMHEKIAEVNI